MKKWVLRPGGKHDHDHDGSHDHSHGFELSGPPEAHRAPLERGAGRGKLVFFDAASGAAGDMCIAALVDLGVPFEVVEQATAALGLSGVHVSLSRAFAGAIGASHFDVHISGNVEERSYVAIRKLIECAPLNAELKRIAQRIFLRLAEAESQVHRISLDDVQFHEVGAADAICDIVGVAACLEYLGAELVCSPLPLGRGFVKCRHGVIPLPAPATVLCLEGIETFDAGLDAELVTPTGAAILGAMAVRCERWPACVPVRSGWGKGTRDLPDRPNVLRVVLADPAEPIRAQNFTHQLLECNVDDMTGEQLSHAVSQLLRGGALDAWVVPITMKKGRPAWTVCALADRASVGTVVACLMAETTTIGVRHTQLCRTELARRTVSVNTEYGPILVKLSGQPGTPEFHAKPEFECCVQAAEAAGVSLRVVIAAALIAAGRSGFE
ncbi:MAG: hypothetical protein RJA70_5019 [Pseudomonadota bacterium]|jgi:uncharacterized protein (TIGR00299 family) protein